MRPGILLALGCMLCGPVALSAEVQSTEAEAAERSAQQKLRPQLMSATSSMPGTSAVARPGSWWANVSSSTSVVTRSGSTSSVRPRTSPQQIMAPPG